MKRGTSEMEIPSGALLGTRKSCKTCMLYEEVLAGKGDHWVKRCEAGCEPVNARWCKAYVPNKEVSVER